MTRVEVAVVGGGVVGAAAAWAVARAGRSVVLLEQFRLGHKRGSSHGSARIFRLSYPEVRYVEMAKQALGLWRQLESETGRRLLTTTGGLDTGPSIDLHASALAQCGVSFEILDSSTARRRFPRLRMPEGPALYQPDAGVLGADLAVRTLIESAVDHGAEVSEEVKVEALELRDPGVHLIMPEGAIVAETAVVAAGAWSKSLLAGAGIDLPVKATRETVAYFRLADELSFPTLVDWVEPSFYSLPAPGLGIKAGLHRAGPPTDPDVPAGVAPDAVHRLTEIVTRRYPDADPSPHLSETCIYTNTDDQSFILERHGPIVVGSACSGHGFKFAPVTGEILARLASDAP
jgi:sarcosine oxidase